MMCKKNLENMVHCIDFLFRENLKHRFLGLILYCGSKRCGSLEEIYKKDFRRLL